MCNQLVFNLGVPLMKCVKKL